MQLTTRKPLSPFIRREQAAHARALSSPMTRIPMAGDPFMGAVTDYDPDRGFDLAQSRAHKGRRACQYAAAMAERAGMFKRSPREYNAEFDGAGRVHFLGYHADEIGTPHAFALEIPPHVLAFDPMAPALQLPAPADDAAPLPRCDLTALLALDSPPSIAAALCEREPVAAEIILPVTLAAAATTKAASKPRKASARKTQTAAEFAASRAARFARIAALPVSARRQIGAR